MDQLEVLRKESGPQLSPGLDDAIIKEFLVKDWRLGAAINKAFKNRKHVDAGLREMDEQACILLLQKKFQSLYPDPTRQPYVPLAAQGPWVVSLHGAVVHDCGGYGMLTFGHSPQNVLEALAEDVVQANIMTASIHQKKLTDALEAEIGRTRKDGCPYESFVMLNSGSEANAFVMRMIDMHAGSVCNGRAVKGLVVKGSFHGRTFEAALLTDTTEEAYANSHLLSHTIRDYKLTVTQNNVEELREIFVQAEKNNWYIETMYLEGVMGEGNPGSPCTPAFYQAARELTKKHGSMLVVDSVQAGLRTTGNLSIVDFPGFSTMDAPDFEVWAKAINAGQYPCSLIALTAYGAKWWKMGIYGNTMTGNPRACAVCTAVLNQITPDFRKGVVEKGKYVLKKYEELRKELPNAIDHVSGTGLLYAVKLNEKHLTVVASDGVEMSLRRMGVNVIHGGTNALRFTPNLDITFEEIDMQVDHVRKALVQTEAYLGQLQSWDKRREMVQSVINQEGKTSAVCTFRLDGHLFDTGFINSVLDTAEDQHSRVLVQNVQVGRDRHDTTVATMQLFADSSDQVRSIMQKFDSMSKGSKVRLSILQDMYEASASKL
jgi:acetylornithine/succinyldiaminopimelate/putrescine aminotransferase